MRVDGLPGRSFLVRYLTLFGGEVTSKFAVLVAFAYLARVLDPREFGAIEFGLSLTVFFVLAAEMGLGSYGAGIVAVAPARAAELIPRAGLVRLLVAVPAYVALVVLSVRGGSAGTGLLAIYGIAVLLAPFNTQWVLQGLRQMQWVAAGSLIRYGTFAVIVLLLVRRGSDTRLVAAAEVAGVVAFTLFQAVLLRRLLTIRLDWRGLWPGALALFRAGWFLGASELTWAAMWYAPIIVLGWTHANESEQVAWLAASVRVVMALHTFVWLYFFNMVPNLSKELRDGVEPWRELIRRSLALSMWAACLIAVGGTLIAPLAMTTLFGDVYEAAAWPFRIVIWMIPVAWFSGHFRFSLIVAGRQNLQFAAAAAAGMLTTVIAIIVAPFSGAFGAAIALLAGGVINAVVAGVLMARAVGAVPVTAAIPAGLACALAIILGVVADRYLGAPAGAVLGSVLYIGLAAALVDVRPLKAVWAAIPLGRKQ